MFFYFCCVVRIEVAEDPGPDQPSHIEVVDLFVIDSLIHLKINSCLKFRDIIVTT